MIDHTSVSVPQAKLDECVRMYVEALKPLGYEKRHEYGPAVGLGSDDGAVPGYKRSDFWIVGGSDAGRTHVAFRAPDRAAVDAFYAAALKAGARDNGAPGVRAMYHANYYGAFVLDAAGNNVEAVCHAGAE